MDINIRDANYEDLERIVEINIESWKNTYNSIIEEKDLLSVNKSNRINKFKQTFNEKKLLVAEIDNKIVGFTWYKENSTKDIYHSEIIALYVDINYRNLGVGKKLFNNVVEKVKINNYNNMIIWCLEKNNNAREFYKKLGGIVVDEKQKFIFLDKQYEEVGYLFEI